jgi:Zn-dependent protease with chaperone function
MPLIARRTRPLVIRHRLAPLVASLLAMLAVSLARINAAAAPVAATDSLAAGSLATDSASTRVPAADSLAADSLAADSLAAPAARDYLAEVRAGFTAENRTYARIRQTLAFLEPLYGLFVGAFLLFSGLSARMRTQVERMIRSRYVQTMLYVALYLLFVSLFAFPFDCYRDWALERQFGLSTQSFGAWVSDVSKSLGLSIIVYGLVPFLWGIYTVLRRSPRFWWFWIAIGTVPVTIVVVLLAPLVIEPVFNRFTPLRDHDLRQAIHALTARADIPSTRVFQVDKSSQTRKLNAYVTGFGSTQRLVFYDTLLEEMKTDEAVVVAGHEIGHYRLGHIWKGILLSGAGAFGFMLLYFAVTRALLARFGASWGVRDLADLASLPLLASSLAVLLFLTAPIPNFVSRSMEHEADIYALEITHDNDAAARAFLKLAGVNRSDPSPAPLVEAFLGTHPAVLDRVRFALDYRPWERGESPQAFFGTPPDSLSGRRP